MKASICWLLAALSIGSGLARAHHSVDAEFDRTRSVTVRGVVKEFHFLNPHSYILVEAREPSGESRKWTLWAVSRAKLSRIDGWTDDMLKSGDTVIATGYRARSGDNGIYLVELETADGKVLLQGERK